MKLTQLNGGFHAHKQSVDCSHATIFNHQDQDHGVVKSMTTVIAGSLT